MKALLIQVADHMQVDLDIVEVAVQLFLFANNVWDQTIIISSSNVQSQWLFCSFFLVVKVVYEDDATLLRCLTLIRRRFKVQRRHWAEMELHYLKTVNFGLADFVLRALHLLS